MYCCAPCREDVCQCQTTPRTRCLIFELFVPLRDTCGRYFASLGAEVEAAGVGLNLVMLHAQKGGGAANAPHFETIAQGIKGSYSGRLLGALELSLIHI